MRPSCKRCSLDNGKDAPAPRRSLVGRNGPGVGRLARAALCISYGALAACSAENAQVGSGLPPGVDASDVGSTLLDRAAPPDMPVDALEGGAVRCDSVAPLRLYYRNLSPSSSSTNINYIIKVENATAAAVPLSSLEVRYYFTNELAAPFETDVFYADTCCSNKMTDFNDRIVMTVKTMAALPNADAYLGIGFTTSLGTLAVGDAVQVEIGFHDPSYARNLTQANDYSYAATATGTQSQWNDCPGSQCEAQFTICAVTVHLDGALAWGTPP